MTLTLNQPVIVKPIPSVVKTDKVNEIMDRIQHYMRGFDQRIKEQKANIQPFMR